jgi:hypothetical protein
MQVSSLRLPPPNSLNGGGYYLGSNIYSYSPIDLAVAGVECTKRCLVCTDLEKFFYQGYHALSENKLSMTIQHFDGYIETESISYFKKQIVIYKSKDILDLMIKNAPLTFKWVNI